MNKFDALHFELYKQVETLTLWYKNHPVYDYNSRGFDFVSKPNTVCEKYEYNQLVKQKDVVLYAKT